jgi:hypothetical protein
MKRTLCSIKSHSWIAGCVVMWVASACHAQPAMPQPTAEHELLKQFAGEWTSKATAAMAEGEEPMTCEGNETAKLMGGFWLVCENEGTVQGTPVSSLLTIGFNPKTKKYLGTFACSSDSTLWNYTGTMDESGKKLVLETEGPLPHDPAKVAKFRETLELVAPDRKVFTSMIQGDDGKWTEFATIEYQRKP